MSEPAATALIVETTAEEDCPLEFFGDSADIVYFISFAHSERYGADHPLAKASSSPAFRFVRRLSTCSAPVARASRQQS